MSINIYDTRTMLQAINLTKPVYTFLRDTFFPNVETFVTENVDVDYKKGKRKMAPFVAPRIGGIVMDRQSFETRTLKTPKIAPERVITIDDINKRAMGESIYSTRTPEERAQELLATDIIELDDYITRREEWMCREILFTGKVIMSGDGFEQEVDYKFTNSTTLSGTDLWSDTTNSDPISDLKEWRLTVIQKTGKAPNICVMASGVVDAFLANTDVRALMDLQRVALGTIEPSVQSPALTYIGKLPSLGLEIYSYDEWYIDDEGTEQPMIPAGKLLLGSTGMNKRLYGAVTQIQGETFITYEGMRIPKSWVDKENEVRKLRITSRPLPAPDDVDAWYVATVL